MSPLGTFAGGLLSGVSFARGTFVRGLMPVPPNFNAYTHRLGFLCLTWSMFTLLVAVYSWPTRSVTNKKRQTRPLSSAGIRPPLPKFSGYAEVDAPAILYPSTIWVRPLFTELGPKNPPKKPILPWSKRTLCRLSGDITNCSAHWRYGNADHSVTNQPSR